MRDYNAILDAFCKQLPLEEQAAAALERSVYLCDAVLAKRDRAARETEDV